MAKLLAFLALVLVGLTGPAWAQTATTEPAATHEATGLEAVGARPDTPAEPMPIGRGNDLPIGPYLLQLVVVTALVGGLGYLSVNFIRTRAPNLGLGLAAGKQIKVVDKVVVDAKRMVFLINVGDRYFLLAATEGQVTPVAELNKGDLGGQFAQLLEQEKNRGEAV